MPPALHPAIDVAALAAAYARDRRVRIAPFLADDYAAAAADMLAARTDFRLVLNAGEKVFEVPRHGPGTLAPADEARLRTAVEQAAQSGFQYCYETVRVPDAAADRDPADPLHALADFLTGDEVIALMRAVTGDGAIDYADAQATAYGPGDLLTAHDDEVAGKRRRAAYVLGLTRDWQEGWGGRLMFHVEQEVAWSPGFNTLALFAVPQPHSVEAVAREAGGRRLSVTGWLRSR